MMQHRSVGPAPLLVLAFMLGSQAVSVISVVSAAPDGRIGVLYLGEPLSPPFYLMINDPLFDISFVEAHVHASGPLGTDQVHRMIRLYMPRTVESLVSRFGVVVLFCATEDAVGTTYIEMIARSVREAGVGLLMSGSQEGFGAHQGKTSWAGTSIAELLPVDVIPEGRTLYGRLVLDQPGHELLSSIPWDMHHPLLASPDTWDHNQATNKPGASQLAHASWEGEEEPLMVVWEVQQQAERARVFALTSPINLLSQELNPWRYHYDLASNLMIYLVHRPVPQDVEIAHQARSKILQIAQRRSILLDVLEFSESFGADTGRIMPEIEEADAAISRAHGQYLELRYEEMLQTSEPIESMIQALERQAVVLKNRALAWVYAIEWLSVTATALFCGFMLWTIMIQRKLYRQVQTTRPRAI